MIKALAAAVLAAGILAPTAHADITDATDQAYLLALSQEGIVYNSAEGAIQTALEVCADWVMTGSALRVIANVQRKTGLHDAGEAAYVVGAASSVYCPDFYPAIRASLKVETTQVGI